MINEIKKGIQEGNLWTKTVCWLLMKIGYSNQQMLVMQVRNKSYRKIEKKYGKRIRELKAANHYTCDDSGKDNIWICWFQGLENAPLLVQKCVDSIYRHMPNAKIHIITAENLSQYVQFPEWVMTKWQKGIINNTKLSNMLRMELLFRYGGLWLDSTVYLTGAVPDCFYQKDLFMYHYGENGNEAFTYNNWCIYSLKGHPFLKTITEIHYEYWRRENKLKNYFIWHMFATIYCKYYPEEFEGIFYVPNRIPHMLQHIIFEPFNQDYYNLLKRTTSIHKLSYKEAGSKQVQGTYYDYIVNDIKTCVEKTADKEIALRGEYES